MSNDDVTIFSNIFLFINTLDGIFFPLSFSLSNGVYYNLFCNNKNNDNSNSLTDDQDTSKNKDNNTSTSFPQSSENEKTFAMVNLKDVNNFDLSFT